MSLNVFNPKNVDFTRQNMFMGEQPNVSRYDVQRYPIFERLINKHLSFFWRPEEVDVSKDSIDFKSLTDHQKHIFLSNIRYQTFLDSVQGRAPNLALLPFVSIPELETLIETWSFSETIHSRSYSYILRNIVDDPGIVFDDIIDDEKIVKRAESATKYYDDLIAYGDLYRVLGEGDHTVNGEKVTVSLTELKRKLIMCVAAINVLEGVRFYVSFACSFAFAENGIMEGNAKLISLIARDENLHLAITQNILRKWAKGDDDPEMATLFRELRKDIRQLYYDVVEQEREWAIFLFKDGSLMGLNENFLSDYVEYIAGKRMTSIGLSNTFPKKNPLPWIDKYLKSSDNQVAPQETEITSYTVGGVLHDIKDNSFDDISIMS